MLWFLIRVGGVSAVFLLIENEPVWKVGIAVMIMWTLGFVEGKFREIEG